MWLRRLACRRRRDRRARGRRGYNGNSRCRGHRRRRGDGGNGRCRGHGRRRYPGNRWSWRHRRGCDGHGRGRGRLGWRRRGRRWRQRRNRRRRGRARRDGWRLRERRHRHGRRRGRRRTRGGGGGGAGGGTIACASPAALVIGGQDTGFVRCGSSVLHRERVVDCPNLLPRAGGGACTALGAATEPCTTDASCTTRPRGFCTTVPTTHAPGCGCVYGCVRDTDCAAGQICECGDPVGICRAASCTTDGQCATGSLCASAALAWGGCSSSPPPRGYECQSPADTCLTNAECSSTSLPACAFSSATGARDCHEGQLLCP